MLVHCPCVPQDALEAVKDDPEGVKRLGIEEGIRTSKLLTEAGAPGLHFYTLNLEKVVLGIMEGLGIKRDISAKLQGVLLGGWVDGWKLAGWVGCQPLQSSHTLLDNLFCPLFACSVKDEPHPCAITKCSVISLCVVFHTPPQEWATLSSTSLPQCP